MAMAAMVMKSAYAIRLRTRDEELHKDAEALNRNFCLSLACFANLREMTVVEGGNDEGETKKAVQKVGERQMQD